jgi:hypothetical protein
MLIIDLSPLLVFVLFPVHLQSAVSAPQASQRSRMSLYRLDIPTDFCELSTHI